MTQPLVDNIPDSLAVDSNDLWAAVDLGSNSFQLLIASYSQGQFQVIDRLREMVRLAAGLGEDQCLDVASQERALECLARFGERLRDIPPEKLKAVGTNTLRKARNPAAFLKKAQAALGHEIDIISGVEEARLIYVGVSRTLPAIEGKQLFIDIGGGSTELASGTGFTPGRLESLYMGCVSMSRNYFPEGQISAQNFVHARTAARLELRPVAAQFRGVNWERAAGASGTIRAAADVAIKQGWIEQNITVNGLQKLVDHMIDCGHVDKLDLSGLSDERLPVFPGGIAILIEVMQQLQIEELAVAQGALREGLLYDLIGRSTEEDSQTLTIRAMETRYHVDIEQADRVEMTAVSLFDQVAHEWGIDQPGLRELLGWSARLHEIGLDIAHSQYQRHSSYLLANSDMSGFSRNEQRMLASLVGAHRRRLSISDPSGSVSGSWLKQATRLAILLRLAVLFNRSRSYEFPELMQLDVAKRTLMLSLPAQWLEDNPLSWADLEGEQQRLKAAGYELILNAKHEA